MDTNSVRFKLAIEAKKFHDHFSHTKGKLSYFSLFPYTQWSFEDFIYQTFSSSSQDTEKMTTKFFSIQSALYYIFVSMLSSLKIISNKKYQKIFFEQCFKLCYLNPNLFYICNLMIDKSHQCKLLLKLTKVNQKNV
jgi:hypothetical protein